MRQEESLEEFLKKVIRPSKEELEELARLRKMPPPTPESVERQLRASGAFRGTAPAKAKRDSKSGPNKKQGS